MRQTSFIRGYELTYPVCCCTSSSKVVDDMAPLFSYGRLSFLTFAWLLVALASAFERLPARPTVFIPHTSSDEATPQQVHISLAGPNYVRISWITSSHSAPSIVEYGETSNVYTKVAKGDNLSYSYIVYKSGLIHNVVVGPVEPSKVYYYRCGGTGSEYSLRTPASAGMQAPVNLAIVGDLGQTGWTISTLQHIQQTEYDLLILPGDLSYADYIQPLWDSFGRLVEPLASSRPWMVTQGNHDEENIPLIINPFRSYNSRWLMPYLESGSDSNLYYSFEVAGVHVLMLGSYTDCNPESGQYKWLQDDLARVDRNRTPWLIAVFHAPWYHSNAEHQGDGAKMMKAMESLLRKAKVDFTFAGHVHAYERTARIFQSKEDPCGMVHITIGDGGNREGLARMFLDPKPKWSVFREASFGHGVLQIINGTHAHWTWHRNQDNETVVADDVWLISLYNSNSCIT